MVSKEELVEALALAEDCREIRIPKKRGGWRIISIPSPELKKVQRKVLRSLRKSSVVYYENVFGLIGGSYAEHTKHHCNSRFIFAFDIKDAFPSVDISKLRSLLKNILLPEGIAEQSKIIDFLEKEPLTFLDLIIKVVTFNRTLPQGAPTSPFLFYLSLTESGLFKKLWILCPQGFKISCYFDNFVISGQKPLPLEAKEKIFKCLEEFGFKVNLKKICQFDCRQGAPLITGIRVNGKGRISLPKKKIRRWRGIIHQAAFESNPENKRLLDQKIEGFIASLKPIYGDKLPPQIEKPYLLFKQRQNKPA